MSWTFAGGCEGCHGIGAYSPNDCEVTLGPVFGSVPAFLCSSLSCYDEPIYYRPQHTFGGDACCADEHVAYGIYAGTATLDFSFDSTQWDGQGGFPCCGIPIPEQE